MSSKAIIRALLGLPPAAKLIYQRTKCVIVNERDKPTQLEYNN